MLRLLGLSSLVLLAVGCGSPYPRLPVVPTEGKVLYRGKPAVGAQVILVPEGDDSADAVKPRGTVKADGTYVLATYPNPDGKPDGAPLGRYRVSVRWTHRPQTAFDPDEPGSAGPPGGPRRDLLNERFSNPKTSGLVVEVDRSGKLTPIELK